jgi:chromosome segregation ATPase
MGTAVQLYQQLHHANHTAAKATKALDALQVECVVLRRSAAQRHAPHESVARLEEDKAKLCEILAAMEEKVNILERASVKVHWEVELQRLQGRIAELEAVAEEKARLAEAHAGSLRELSALQSTVAVQKQDLDGKRAEIASLSQKVLELESSHGHCGSVIQQLQSQVAVLSNTQQVLQESRQQLMDEHQRARDVIHSQLANTQVMEAKMHNVGLTVAGQNKALRVRFLDVFYFFLCQCTFF